MHHQRSARSSALVGIGSGILVNEVNGLPEGERATAAGLVDDYNDNVLIRAFGVNPDGSVRDGRIFHKLTGTEPGVADGMKCDQEGNVYCTGPGGIHVIDRHGALLGRLRIPGHATNMAWGDDDWCSLYVTTYDYVLRTRLKIPGVPAW